MDQNLEKRLKRQVIGKPHRFWAVAPLGFEATLARELQGFGIEAAPTNDGKVEFTGKITDAWKAVAYSRIANRIMMHIADFKAENFRDLEKKAAEIPWELYLPCHPERGSASSPTLLRSLSKRSASKGEVEGSISIHVSCKHSRLYHSDAVAERLQKVIKGGCIPLAPADAASATPSAGTPRNAPQNLFVTLIDDRCTIMLDLAGEELYKRGHERFVNDAPLKETLAAGMILETIEILRLRAAHSAQDDTAPANITLIDPMAGSGTFSLEAAYMASGLIPGKCRDFALKHQPAFKPATWNHIVNSTSHTPHSTSHTIVTSDISERAVEITRHNVEHSPLATIAPGLVDPQVRDFFSYKAEDFKPLAGQTVILLNPPYGKRLNFDAPKLYAKIGKHLQNECGDGNRFKDGIHIAILCPKEACREKLLQNCPALDPSKNRFAREIFTSHGGFGLSCFVV